MSCINERAAANSATKEELQSSLDQAKKIKQSLLKKKASHRKRDKNLQTLNVVQSNGSPASKEFLESNSVIAFPLKPSAKDILNRVNADAGANLFRYLIENSTSVDTLDIVDMFDTTTAKGLSKTIIDGRTFLGVWQETNSFNYNGKVYYAGAYVHVEVINVDPKSNVLSLPTVATQENNSEIEENTHLIRKLWVEHGDTFLADIKLEKTPHYEKGSSYFHIRNSNLISGSVISVTLYMSPITEEGEIGNLVSVGYPSKVNGFQFEHIEEGADAVGFPEPIEPTLSGSSSYQVNNSRPYGPFWKTVLPGGYPVGGPKCSTKESAKKIVDENIDLIISTLVTGPNAPYPDVANITNFKEEFATTFYHICLIESGGVLYAPQSKFDIRPRVGSGVSGIRNLLDTGPRPRNGMYKINSTHRPTNTKLFSACGLAQYTIDTWTSLFRTWSETYGATETYLHVWDAPPKWQVLLQGSEFIERIYNKTSPAKLSGNQYPAIWRAVGAYLKNVHGGPGNSFFTETVSRINAKAAQQGGDVDLTTSHQICREVWESASLEQGNWYYTSTRLNEGHIKQKYSIGRKMALSSSSLPVKYPNIYESSRNLLPKIKRG